MFEGFVEGFGEIDWFVQLFEQFRTNSDAKDSLAQELKNIAYDPKSCRVLEQQIKR